MLDTDLLPFYVDRSLAVTAVLTDNGREFWGTDTNLTSFTKFAHEPLLGDSCSDLDAVELSTIPVCRTYMPPLVI